MKFFMLVSAIVLALGGVLLADTIYLKDGTVREGKVIEVTDREVRLRITYGQSVGIIAIPRESVSRIVRAAPDPVRLRKEAYDLLASEAFNDAVAAFREVVELLPEDADAHADLGLAYVLSGRFVEALKAYGKACELAPDEPDFLIGLGHAYQRLGSLENALEQYASYVEANPASPEGYRLMAEVHMAGKAYVKALQSARKAVSLAENDVQSRMTLARLYQVLELPEDAIAQTDAAIKLAPELGEAYLLRGELLLEAGRENEALADLTRATELNPNLAEQAADIAAGGPPEEAEKTEQEEVIPAPIEQPESQAKEKKAKQEDSPAPEKAVLGEEKPADGLDKVRELLNEAIRRLEKLKAGRGESE